MRNRVNNHLDSILTVKSENCPKIPPKSIELKISSKQSIANLIRIDNWTKFMQKICKLNNIQLLIETSDSVQVDSISINSQLI